MTFPANIQSATPAKYLFKLISDNRTVICDPEPLEWASGTFTMNRDLEVGGVFSSYMNSLTFVGTGAELLKGLWNAYGLNAKCELAIYYFKDSIREYVEFPFRFDINFCIYEVVKVGKFAFGIKVKAINNSLQTKFDNRKDLDIDVTKSSSIGEQSIDVFGTKKFINYEAVNQKVYAKMYSNAARTWQGPRGSGYWSGNWDLPRVSGIDCFTTIPLNITSSDYSECSETVYQARMATLASCNSFFNDAKYTYELSVNCKLIVSVIDKHTGLDAWQVQIIETDYNNSIINTTDLTSWGNDEGFFTFQRTVNITVTKGSTLRFVVKVLNIASIKATLHNATIELTQTIVSSPARKVTGLPIYDAFEMLCKQIFDTKWPFYSDFFGRTDTWKNGKFQFYASENQLRFAHIQSGLNLRGIDIDDPHSSLVLNFKNLFKTAQTIWNIGYCIESNPVKFGDSELRLRIEEYAHFFDGETLTLDLSSRINKYDIISMVMPELCPVQLNSGFSNCEYLQMNGRAEPNTTNQRTSKINTDSKFDNISPFRGDTKGILSALAAPIDTTDTKSDDGIFIVKTQRQGSNEWKPEKDENITIEENSSIFGNDQLNRYFTPTRMLIRQANKITSGFTPADLKASKLTFQSSDKLQTLKTGFTSQAGSDQYKIAENDDILISTLADPLYLPIKHTIECWFDFADLEAIIANPFGYIKISDEISGFLLTLKKKNNEAKAEITIIQKGGDPYSLMGLTLEDGVSYISEEDSTNIIISED